MDENETPLVVSNYVDPSERRSCRTVRFQSTYLDARYGVR